MRRMILPVALLLVVSLIGCEQYVIERPDVPTDVSFSADVQAIFDANCISCHSGGTPPDLSAGNSYDALIDDDYIDTSDPEGSLLYTTLRGNHDDKAEEIEKLTILGWIMEGAENN